jgi:hypothetical protein
MRPPIVSPPDDQARVGLEEIHGSVVAVFRLKVRDELVGGRKFDRSGHCGAGWTLDLNRAPVALTVETRGTWVEAGEVAPAHAPLRGGKTSHTGGASRGTAPDCRPRSDNVSVGVTDTWTDPDVALSRRVQGYSDNVAPCSPMASARRLPGLPVVRLRRTT